MIQSFFMLKKMTLARLMLLYTCFIIIDKKKSEMSETH